MAFVVNLPVKFNSNIFLGDRDMLFYFFADLAVICLFRSIWDFFWVGGGVDSLHRVRYCQNPPPPKAYLWHLWPESRVLAYRSPRGKKKKLRDDKLYMCADRPRNAARIKVFMCGGVQDIVNPAEFRYNWLRCYSSPWRVKFAILICVAIWLPLNMWLNTRSNVRVLIVRLVKCWEW